MPFASDSEEDEEKSTTYREEDDDRTDRQKPREAIHDEVNQRLSFRFRPHGVFVGISCPPQAGSGSGVELTRLLPEHPHSRGIPGWTSIRMHLIKAAMPKPNHRVFVKRLEDGWYVFAAGGRYNIPLEKHEATERALSEARLLSLAEIGVYDGRDQLLETVPTKRS